MLDDRGGGRQHQGKNAVMKIRKMEGTSPMPNQRIAKGIQARGERLRKEIHRREKGEPNPDAQTQPEADRDSERHREPNPIVTRNNEATMSSKSDP